VTLAHLLTKATRQDMAARFAAKWKLIQLLYQRRWEKQRIIDLFVVLDWMMRLPEHLAQELWQNIDLLEEQEQMRYVSSVERIGIEKGREQGREQGLQQGEALALQRLLRKRFGAIPSEISARIAAASLSEIEGWFDQAKAGSTKPSKRVGSTTSSGRPHTEAGALSGSLPSSLPMG